MKLKDLLKRKRIIKNMTQNEMADLIGISRVTYIKLETYKNYMPSFEVVEKLCSYLGKSPEVVRRMLDENNK